MSGKLRSLLTVIAATYVTYVPIELPFIFANMGLFTYDLKGELPIKPPRGLGCRSSPGVNIWRPGAILPDADPPHL